MCPCPICATIALLLVPFMGYKWAKNFVKKHHCSCEVCQQADQANAPKSVKCTCRNCGGKKKSVVQKTARSTKKGKKNA